MKPLTVVLICFGTSIATFLGIQLLMGNGLPATTDVPTLVGLNVEQARRLSDTATLLLRFEGERVPDSDQIPPGTVIEQKPLGGSRVRIGEVVYATLASAPQRTRVPVLLEQTLEVAQKTLEEAGLRLGSTSELVSTTVAAGQVIESRPSAGSELRKGEAVSLVLSKASEIVVPNLRNLSAAGARSALEKLGLMLGERHFAVDDNAADGVILRQSPAANSQAQRGQKVDIWVNQ